MMSNMSQDLRIIAAIAAKDMWEALKNRTTLSVLVMSLLMVLLYRFLPDLTSDDPTLHLLVYDAGNTAHWDALEASYDPQVFGPYPTQRLMASDLAKGVTPELGMVIPEDFDEMVLGSGDVAVMGYVMSWVGESTAAEMVTAAEALLTDVAERPVRVLTAGNEIYPQAEGFGYPMLYSIGLVIGVLMVGVTMTPNLMMEEREAKTIDALLISPAGNRHLVIGKALTGIFYCLIMAAIGALLSGGLILHWWLFTLAAIVGSLFSVAFGLLLGTFFKSRQQLTAWAFFLSFPLMLPLFLTWMKGLIPDTVIAILEWVPSVAMGKIFRASFAETSILAAYGLEMTLVLGCALLLFAIVAWLLRRSDR
jgi:ABC-2 type transport system permease protein